MLRAQKRMGKDLISALCACMLSHSVTLTLCDPMDYVACQAPLSMGFFRKEYWSGLPHPPPGDLPHLGIEHASVTSTCIGRCVLYHWCHLGSPISALERQNGSHPLGIPTTSCMIHSIVVVKSLSHV